MSKIHTQTVKGDLNINGNLRVEGDLVVEGLIIEAQNGDGSVQAFDNANWTIHVNHPELKELWEEYRILRKLKLGL